MNGETNKIVVIGDIHGRDIWKEILKGYKGEETVVFVGDYFDTHYDISVETQLKNFASIIDLKREYPEKVKLLIGNHDFHYMPGAGNDKYSGYQYAFANEISSILKFFMDDLQLCFVDGFKVFSHAGMTKTWCTNNGINYTEKELLESAVNNLFLTKPESFRFATEKITNSFGDDPVQSPIWVRPTSMMADSIPDVIQIVGHTQIGNVKRFPNAILVDTLEDGYYITITNGVVKVLNIKDNAEEKKGSQS